MGLFTPEHWLVNNLCLVWKGPPAPVPGRSLWTHYVFVMQNPSLPACCLFCLCSYQNDANVSEKCHVMKMHYICHVPRTGPPTNVIFISCPRWWLCVTSSSFHSLTGGRLPCNCSDPVYTEYSNMPGKQIKKRCFSLYISQTNTSKIPS